MRAAQLAKQKKQKWGEFKTSEMGQIQNSVSLTVDRVKSTGGTCPPPNF